MKASMFNIFFSYKNKEYLTNTVSKSVTELDNDHKRLIENNNLSQLSENDQNYLLQQGFAVDDSINEIGLLRYRSCKLRTSKEEMEFVIAPTLACNFCCTYCFENPRSGYMSPSVQSDVLSFIFRQSQSDENKRIHIIWFGGEPLLYPEIVIDMNEKIYNYCLKNGKEFRSDIITNGYLLDSELLSRLEKAHINHFQITIDGIKEIHDTRRMLFNGAGTYDVIYNNLKLFSDFGFSVTVRVNIDKSNISCFSMIENEIAAINNSKIECSPALVEISEKHCNDIWDQCFTDESGLNYYYNNDHIKKYYTSQRVSDYSLRLFFCEAEHHYSFAIDELGNVYKCWNSLGCDQDILCSVNDDEYNPAVLSTFFARDPFTEDDCKNCPYIPICGGGCLMQKILHKNKNFCADCKHTFLQSVKNEIDDSQREEV